MLIEIIGGDFNKQACFVANDELIVKIDSDTSRRYYLKRAIEDIDQISADNKTITFKIHFKDEQAAICTAQRKAYDQLHVLKESKADPRDRAYEDFQHFKPLQALWKLFLKLIKIGLVILIIFLSLTLLIVINTSAPEEEDKSQLPALKEQAQTIKPLPSEQPQALNIADHAISPITQSGYPTTFKKWGADKIAHINSLQGPAAVKILSSGGCDRLELLGLSTDRSSPPNKIIFFGNCSNGKQFYVSEAEIKSSAAVESKADKLAKISDDQAQQACISQTTAMLNFPSSFDLKTLSLNVNRGMTGNIAVAFNFDAKNGLGVVLPRKARCIIDDQGIHPVEISNR